MPGIKRQSLSIVHGLAFSRQTQPRTRQVGLSNCLVHNIDDAANCAVREKQRCGPSNHFDLLGIFEHDLVDVVAAQARYIARHMTIL